MGVNFTFNHHIESTVLDNNTIDWKIAALFVLVHVTKVKGESPEIFLGFFLLKFSVSQEQHFYPGLPASYIFNQVSVEIQPVT